MIKLCVLLNLFVLAFASRSGKDSVGHYKYIPASQTYISKETGKVRKNRLRGDFTITSNQLVQDVGDVVGNRGRGNVNLFYADPGEGKVKNAFQFLSQINDNGQILFSVPELYTELKFGPNSIAFGRKVLEWGVMDLNWGFGQINNRVNFDFFNPGNEGLTGVAFEHKNSQGFTFSAFASFLYIPELNPGQTYDEDQGEVRCRNPWCRPLAKQTTLEEKTIDIFYDIDMPNPEEVVFRTSAGARLLFEPVNYVELEAFFLRKPENQISVAADVSLIVEGFVGNVSVTPQVYYHDVTGANAKVKLDDRWQIYGEYFQVTPEIFPDSPEVLIQNTGLKPKKIDQRYLGGGVNYAHQDLMFGVNYIARVSEFNLDAQDILTEYPRWNQAWHAYFISNITAKLNIKMDVKIDQLTEDRLSQFEFGYQYNPSFFLSAGANIIGSGDKDSFWSEFENNDSVYVSSRYYF